MTKESVKKAQNTLCSSIEFMQLHEWEKVNFFDVLKLGSHEVRHSNMLAWLMNPHGSHGFGDAFLHKLFNSSDFLKCLCKIDSTSFMVKTEDFNIVGNKQGRIDILLISETSKVVVCIENKISSSEHDFQLERYKKDICKRFPDYRQFFVYLTLNKEKPSDSDWKEMSYDNVYDSLLACMEEHKSAIDDDVAMILIHYQRLLEKIMPEHGRLFVLRQQIFASEILKTSLDEMRRIWNTPEIDFIDESVKRLLCDILKLNLPSQTEQYANVIRQWLDTKKSKGQIISYDSTHNGWISFITKGLSRHYEKYELKYKSQPFFAKVAYQLRNDLDSSGCIKNFPLRFFIKKLEGQELDFFREEYSKLCKACGEKVGNLVATGQVHNFALNNRFELKDTSTQNFAEKLQEYLDERLNAIESWESIHLVHRPIV